MKRGQRHSPKTRALIAERTRARMADPAIRAKISERTKAGMAGKAPWAPELERLERVWNDSSSEARRAFLAKILGPIGAQARRSPASAPAR